MESYFTLDTQDGFKIYGILNKAKNPNGKAVVFAHGLTGHPHEHHYQTGRRYFNERGYDVVRFSFYTDQKNARQLVNTTLSDHAKDLQTVINNFKNTYHSIYVAGHSYGGLTTIICNPEVKAISLWDPTVIPYQALWKNLRKIPKTQFFDFKLHVSILVGDPMYEESKEYTHEETLTLASQLKSPTQLVLVEHQKPGRNRGIIWDSIPDPKEKVIINGATHVFVEDDTVFDLLEKTYTWFERF